MILSITALALIALTMKLGRAYGKFLKNCMLPNMAGYCLAGSEKTPPKIHLAIINGPSSETNLSKEQ
jgi:hypothetical protein